MKIEDRLTAFVDLKEFCKSVPEAYGAVIRGKSRACDEAFQRYPFLPVAIDRLRMYEDTGLSPEEVEELKHKHDRLQDFEVANNEKLRKQIASLEDQLQEALAADGHKIKCEIYITVEGLRERDACPNDGKKKQRIPWEAD